MSRRGACPTDAEVVYGHADSERVEAVKEVSGQVEIFHQRRLGDFEP